MKVKIKIITGVLALVVFLATGVTYAQSNIRGNGKVVKTEREVKGFNELEVSSAFNVYLTQGNTELLTIEADENLIEYIKTEVVSGELRIYTKKSFKNYDKLNIYLTFKSLDDIDISGAVDLYGENAMNFDELEIEASGASEVKMELTASKLELDLSGASDVELKGKADRVELDCSGASDVYCLDLETNYFSIDASGSSTAKVFVNKELSVEASGASTVKYKGNPSINSDVSGAGSIKNIN